MKYSEELVDELVKYVESGASNKDAAVLAGVSEDTFYTWKKKDLSDGTPNPDYHSEFSELLKKATVKRKVAMVNRILTAAKESWQAAAWYLERKHNSEFGKKERHDISINPQEEIKRMISRINNKNEDSESL